MYDVIQCIVKSEHKVQLERVCVTHTGGVTAHRILSIRLKVLNRLIYPPITCPDQARLWQAGRKDKVEDRI